MDLFVMDFTAINVHKMYLNYSKIILSYFKGE